MNMWKLAIAIALLAATSPAAGQTQAERDCAVRLFPVRATIDLLRALTLTEPTVLILVEIPDGPSVRDNVTRAQHVGDSIATALQPTALRFGFAVAIRATTYQGAVDPVANAYYLPSPARGAGILLLQPASKPSRLYQWLGPEQLVTAIMDFTTLFRHSVPL